MTTTIQRGAQPQTRTSSEWARADLLIVAALVVTAFVLRLPAFPTDGLFHDDAWTAVSITLTSPHEWLRTSFGQPGFVALLSPLRYLGRSDPTVLVVPVLVAGALAPAAVFVLLRSLAYARSIATLLAAVLVVAPGPIMFSGHLKTYVADIVIVALVAAVLPRLTSITWTARVGAVWFVGAVLLGTFSVFTLLVTVAAGVVLVWMARHDRGTRAFAVAVQFIVQIGYGLYLRTTRSGPDLDKFWESRNGFIELDANPFVSIGRLFVHVRRVGASFLGVGGTVAAVAVIAALVGLVLASRRRDSIAARFLLVLLVAAAAAGAAKLLPFGAGPGTYPGRISLWLSPVFAVGLAEIGRRLRFAFRPRLRRAFDGAIYVSAIALVAANVGDSPRYNLDGAESAVEYIESHLSASDLVVPFSHSAYSYATETRLPVNLVPDSQEAAGTRLIFDERVLPVETPQFRSHLRERLMRARVVYTVATVPALRDDPRHEVANEELRAAGFVGAFVENFDDATVVTWGRPAKSPTDGPP